MITATTLSTGVDDFETISITINGENFENWSEISLEQAVDAFASVSFTAPFEPSRKAFRDAFRPFSFNDVEVYIGADLAFTGTMVDVSPEIDAASKSVSVSCYSKPAVLHDCTPEITSPIEFNKRLLHRQAVRPDLTCCGRRFCRCHRPNVARHQNRRDAE